MATGFFALFDDIALLMDDVSTVSQVATQKTAGILGDDLAVNAEKASGFSASRELPVLWAITKGSLLNKLIILPFAFLLSAFAPWAIVPILMVGGVYLAYEGAEKIHEYFYPHTPHQPIKDLTPLSKEMILSQEKSKIKSALITDFILSIEIIIIALSTVTEQTLPVQIIVVSLIALLATVGVYGIVALLVRIDDVGYGMIRRSGGLGVGTTIGQFLVRLLPKLIQSLTVIGTIAMLLVAGGIFLHNLHTLHALLDFMPMLLGDLVVGLGVGGIALMGMRLLKRG